MDNKAEGSDAHTDPTRILKDEHQAILLKLELITRALKCLRLGPGESVPERADAGQTLLRDLIIGLEQAIASHFQKEELALFPVLAEYIGKEHGPIEVMLYEHQRIRSVLHRSKAILCEASGTVKEEMRKTVLELGFEVVHLLRQHINKENRILFKVCETSLSEGEKKKIMERMKGIRHDAKVETSKKQTA